jgi:hypothetical protein
MQAALIQCLDPELPTQLLPLHARQGAIYVRSSGVHPDVVKRPGTPGMETEESHGHSACILLLDLITTNALQEVRLKQT